MESLGALAGGIAHEFNNVLGVIVGNAGLASSDLPPGHPALVSLGQIQLAAERAGALVEQILRFARQDPADRQPIPLQQALADTLPLLRAAIPLSVELACRCTLDRPVTVLADRTAVHQVLMNLCANAWQAMGGTRGHIVVSLSQIDGGGLGTPGEGGPEADAPASLAVLTVSDDGAGMDAATLARIFEPFFTTKPVGQGTGLGLATVKRLVESLGGTIRARSTLGVGSEFIVHLPVHAAPEPPPPAFASPAPTAAGIAGGPAAAPAPAPATAPPPGVLRALVVDDEASVLRFTRLALERRGWTVTACDSAVEALARVRSAPDGVDVVLADLRIPLMSGLELARALATLRPALPVILASGALTPDVRLAGSAAGVAGFLVKPFEADTLADLLRTAVGKTGGSNAARGQD